MHRPFDRDNLPLVYEAADRAFEKSQRALVLGDAVGFHAAAGEHAAWAALHERIVTGATLH